MVTFLQDFWNWNRTEFTRMSTFENFTLVFTGILKQGDDLGVTALARAIKEESQTYVRMLHFFRSTAWNGGDLLLNSAKQVLAHDLDVVVNGRNCLLMDDCNMSKEGVRMPLVGTLRQTSETSSKPSHFRGQSFGLVGILGHARGKDVAFPASAEFYQPGKNSQEDGTSRTHKLVSAGIAVSGALGISSFLIGDAWFNNKTAVGLVRKTEGEVELISRARVDAVGYLAPPVKETKTVGRPRMYGKKINLRSLFTNRNTPFVDGTAKLYGKQQSVKTYAINLIRKPGDEIRFILAKTKRGRIVVTSTDLTIDPVVALELYARRSAIEETFDAAKNVLGAKSCRFWTMGLERVSRRPAKNDVARVVTQEDAVAAATNAHSNKLQMTMTVLMFLQMVACIFGEQVTEKADFWTRTPPRSTPSPRFARHAMVNQLHELNALLPQCCARSIQNTPPTPSVVVLAEGNLNL
jgi:hypothetical protein